MLLRTPKNLGVDTFPWRPFWILQAVWRCRQWASAPFAARLVSLPENIVSYKFVCDYPISTILKLLHLIIHHLGHFFHISCFLFIDFWEFSKNLLQSAKILLQVCSWCSRIRCNLFCSSVCVLTCMDKVNWAMCDELMDSECWLSYLDMVTLGTPHRYYLPWPCATYTGCLENNTILFKWRVIEGKSKWTNLRNRKIGDQQIQVL